MIKANPSCGQVLMEDIIGAIKSVVCNRVTLYIWHVCILFAFRPNTILVTIMLANNETGVVQVNELLCILYLKILLFQPVKEISSALATLRKEQKHTYPFLHTDSAQVYMMYR